MTTSETEVVVMWKRILEALTGRRARRAMLEQDVELWMRRASFVADSRRAPASR